MKLYRKRLENAASEITGFGDRTGALHGVLEECLEELDFLQHEAVSYLMQCFSYKEVLVAIQEEDEPDLTLDALQKRAQRGKAQILAMLRDRAMKGKK